jgi:hypothetical protein
MEDQSSMTGDCDKLAESIANEVFGGKLPRYPRLIVEALLGTISDVELPAVPVEIIEEAKKRWADALLAALNDRIDAQDAAERQFQN